ncbi:tyrosine-type recombinase/integrase [Staphylococcus succinus]|uniref:tyrosine-type recombinase/integrase n=1 Tax=Staphylococcus succinus TaxID=61015 RepID=UPI00217561BB|nr:tyrosine-type recombinase/integrase [Staphylococcus succinus]
MFFYFSRTKKFYLYTALAIEFQSLTGLRIGELLAIKVNDIDFENKTLSVNGTMFWAKSDERFGSKETTKTNKSYRVINLTTRCIEIINKLVLEK